jgi:hypothetical protein
LSFPAIRTSNENAKSQGELQLNLLMSLNPASNGAIILQKRSQVHTTPARRMLYYSRLMRKLLHPALLIGISLLLALLSAGITYSAQLSSLRQTTGAALFFQVTPTPQIEEDLSEVGSTDGIVIMGGVIGLIIIVPILVKRKTWMRVE